MSDQPTVSIAAAPPATDCQDPLPESNWLYRRWLVFAGEALRAVGLAFIMFALYGVATTGPAGAEATGYLYQLGVWLIILSLVDRVLYLVAPSAEQATKMMATVSAWRGGVFTSPVLRSAATPSPPEEERDAAPTSRTT
jgi:hypothetical protein